MKKKAGVTNNRILRSEQLLSSAETMEDGLFTLNSQKQITYINKFAAKLFGKRVSELYGFKLDQALPKSIYPIFNRGVSQAFKLKKTYTFEIFSKTLKKWISVRVYPAVGGLTIYFQDITLQKKLESELRAEEEHRQLLLGGISHELKNLLTSSKAYLQLLNSRLTSSNDQESLNYLNKTDNRLSSLSSMMLDFMDLVRIRSDRLRLEKKKTDLAKLLEELILEIEITNPSHHLKLDLKSNPKVKIDPDKIKQVLINLIDNAIKYSPKSKEVRIKLQTKEKNAAISIQDFGIGIAPKFQKQLFGPFYRANLEKRKQAGGIGLGLYISSEIIKLHGGSIIVKSQKNKGSTFKVLLPLKQK